jgi:hypothetical protein
MEGKELSRVRGRALCFLLGMSCGNNLVRERAIVKTDGSSGLLFSPPLTV